MQPGSLPALHADPFGPHHGPLAHAYACGVHIAVDGEGLWNAVDKVCACCTAEQKREGMRDDWGIATTEDWRAQQEALIDDDGSSPLASLVLGLRSQLVQQYGTPVDATAWRSEIDRWCKHNGRGSDVYRDLLGLAGMILDYEKRFAADGLLPPGGFIAHLGAWDFGRGANMARWGVQCGWADLATSQWYAVRAGGQAARYHVSWADFSAAYILGRCLHFDQGEFGWRYTDPLAVHHTMMSHPQSPWVHIPFRF